jgi:type II secretory pathway component PulF
MILEFIGRLAIFGLYWALLLGVFYVFYFWLSRPLKKQEEARVFIQLLRLAVKGGRSIEATLIEASRTRDRTIPVWLHYLAAHLEAGFPLPEALEKSKLIIPPSIVRLLQVGLKNNTLPGLLQHADDLQFQPLSRAFQGVDLLYLGLLAFFPAISSVTITLMVFVVPKFESIVAGMGGNTETTNVLRQVFSIAPAFALVATVLVYSLAFAYMGFSLSWPRYLRVPLDRATLFVPYVRTRAVRTFTMALSFFIDAGVSEKEAVVQAAELTGNLHFEKLALRCSSDLEHGISLPEALKQFDQMEQVAARCDFAAASNLPFQKALAGWLDFLKSREAQQEQTLCHALSSAMTVLNGIFIGTITCCLFAALISIIEAQ